jgi:hypothetical protein
MFCKKESRDESQAIPKMARNPEIDRGPEEGNTARLEKQGHGWRGRSIAWRSLKTDRQQACNRWDNSDMQFRYSSIRSGVEREERTVHDLESRLKPIKAKFGLCEMHMISATDLQQLLNYAAAIGGDEGGGDAFTGEGIGEDTDGGAGGVETGNDDVGRAALGRKINGIARRSLGRTPGIGGGSCLINVVNHHGGDFVLP